MVSALQKSRSILLPLFNLPRRVSTSDIVKQLLIMFIDIAAIQAFVIMKLTISVAGYLHPFRCKVPPLGDRAAIKSKQITPRN